MISYQQGGTRVAGLGSNVGFCNLFSISAFNLFFRYDGQPQPTSQANDEIEDHFDWDSIM